MKTCKLCVHNDKTYKNQEILLCAKDFPNVKAGDVVELYHPDDEWNRLLLQVKCLPEDYQQRDAVSIEQTICNTFSLKNYKKIVVSKVEPKNITLDLVEILFKEQYFGRSDMWRMNSSLTNTCVYLKKSLEFAGMRATVQELWSQGENVTSGLITEDTRVVFRSPTAVVQIFIQISTEMWDFDLHGDLYFEKAVNGFLTDLFARWKEQKCLHDVTIVMFSRTYYDAKSFDEFPPAVRECLQIDCRGCIYEDFYRVVIQNERYEEWSYVLRDLRTIFNTYEEILNFHHPSSDRMKMPKGTISMAAQGNFLETLNMSLNLFEKYYMDRNFDRTGKVSVVITPGPGVFEVDRQLANITKQRTIDCGVGSDLVCMGEQPLHAAPLFKFHSKSSDHSIEVGDDYNIPHWMNHSFYMSKNQIENHMNSPFVPRIKPPPALLKELEEGPKTEKKSLLHRKDDSHETNIPFVDYDEYDAQVFKLPSGTIPPRTFTARKDPLVMSGLVMRGSAHPKTFAEAKRTRVPRTRHISDEVCAYSFDRREADKEKTAAITIPSRQNSNDDLSISFGCYPIQERTLSRDSFESSESDELIHQRFVVGSAGSPVSHSRGLHNYRPRRALINPFAPSRLQFKMTSNRRRWVHAFPVDKSGKAMQARHVHSVQPSGKETDFPWATKPRGPVMTLVTGNTKKTKAYIDHYDPDNDLASQGSESMGGSPISHAMSISKRNALDNQSRQRSVKRSSRLGGNKPHAIFGSVKSGSEQNWSPDMNTAVDWKSLTIPASLPLTTDYFPDRHSLQYDYYVASYQFDVAEEGWGYLHRPSNVDEKDWLVYHRPPLTTQQVFMELISQRLGQGFQLITKNSSKQSEPKPDPPKASPNTSGLFGLINEPDNECYMNIGRIYHKLISRGSSIDVTWWRPSHPTPQLQYEYRYRFQDPDSYTYEVSWTNFSNERLENYNWNHLDKYICTQGDYWECGLIDSLKYWRSRFFLLPMNNPATKKIIEKETTRCDIYEERSLEDCKYLIHGFIKFLETINKIRRSKPKSEVGTSGGGAASQGDASPRKLETDGVVDREEKLASTSPSLWIVEAMMDPVDGLSLIQNQAGLPSNCFISKEAVAWCRQNVAGIDTTAGAVALLQRLMDDHLVLHCSGNPQHKFIYGFYLYYVPSKVLSKPDTSMGGHPGSHLATPGANFNLLFQNEWCEVAVLPVHEEDEPHLDDTDAEDEATPKGGSPGTSPPTQQAHFFLPMDKRDSVAKILLTAESRRKRSDSELIPEIEDWRVVTGFTEHKSGQPTATLLHKYTNVEVDPAKKSDRREFAIARYHAYYSPVCAFELQLQWMVATGGILGDLVYSYARKASLCGFHLLPVPCDPFALPYNNSSDPLRGPTFVPLDMEAFPDDLLKDYTSEKRQDMLYKIQDAIVKRFGFMPCSVKVPELDRDESNHGQRRKPSNYGYSYTSSHSGEEVQENFNHQYVHCTAGMFILIPDSNLSQDWHSQTSTMLRPPRTSSTATMVSALVGTSPFSSSRLSNAGLGITAGAIGGSVLAGTSPYSSASSSTTGAGDGAVSPEPLDPMEMSKRSSADLHKLYIARQAERPEKQVGFLWTWNYMSSKRWRSPNTGDEAFQDTMLADFRRFCSNDEGRLTEFWDNFKGALDE